MIIIVRYEASINGCKREIITIGMKYTHRYAQDLPILIFHTRKSRRTIFLIINTN